MEKYKVFIFYVVLNVFSFSSIHSQELSETPPNILVVVVDDLGYYDLSFTGSQLYNTPNIDALACASGVPFLLIASDARAAVKINAFWCP